MTGSLLPPNATTFEREIELTQSSIDVLPVPVRDMWNPYTCPVSHLPWLAWAMSVDYWKSEWDEQTKRDVIAASIEIHRYKGTPWAVKEALNAAGYADVVLKEWFQYGGAPGYFRVGAVLAEGGQSEEHRALLISLIGRAKNTRSWLELYLYLVGDAPLYYGAATLGGETITVYPQT